MRCLIRLSLFRVVVVLVIVGRSPGVLDSRGTGDVRGGVSRGGGGVDGGGSVGERRGYLLRGLGHGGLDSLVETVVIYETSRESISQPNHPRAVQ